MPRNRITAFDEDKANARKAKIPIAKARQIARHLDLAGQIAGEYDCIIFISPARAGLYPKAKWRGLDGGGMENNWAIIDVDGPFDGGDF